MNKYYAWIKNLTSIVYDNSKSEYQILSELIPILLDIKDNQDTNSSNMDTFYNELIEKIKTVQEDMTNFTPTYNSLKLSIQQIINNQDLVNDVINGFNTIITTINNYVSKYLNENGRNDIISSINENFNDNFLENKESDYIVLIGYGSEPSSANLNDHYYNTSENKLYKYNGSSWEEDIIMINQLYLFNNKLYAGKCNVTTKTINQALNIALTDELFIYLANNSNNLILYNINTNERTVYQANLPSDFEIITLPYIDTCKAAYFNNKYYIIYQMKDSDRCKLMYTEDFINFNTIDTDFNSESCIRIINNNLYINNITNYLLENDTLINIMPIHPYKFENGLYYGIRMYASNPTFDIVTSSNPNFNDYEKISTQPSTGFQYSANYFKYYNYELIFGSIFLNNKLIEELESIKCDNILLSYQKPINYYSSFNYNKFNSNYFNISSLINTTQYTPFVNYYTDKLYLSNDTDNLTYEVTFSLSIEEL